MKALSRPLSGMDGIRVSAPFLAAKMLLIAWLLAAGIWYAMTTLLTIINFAWLQLAYDQFRSYTYYLWLPFPENVLVMENGHRPVIPALLRVAEIQWLAANQMLQITFGTVCAAATALLIAVVAWRDRESDVLIRATGVMLAFLGIFWLGNARMLLHGTESEHAYLIMLCLVGGLLMVRRAVMTGSSTWTWAAAGCCVIATFTFGAGIALFPTFLMVGWLLRASWRQLSVIAGTAATCLLLYLAVLPGDGGVRASLDFRPVDSLIVAAQWLSSPWISGWLGLADPQVNGMMVHAVPGTWLKQSANLLQSLLHLELKSTGAMLIGFGGLAAVAVAIVAKLRHRGAMTSIRTLAFGLVVFSAAAAAVIGIGRLDYLRQHPGQIFADRYLLWPCLFWLGTCLLALSTTRPRGLWLRRATIAFAALLPIAMLPFHQYGAGWGAAVYRLNQSSAAAAQSDLFDDRLFDTGDDATLEQRVLVYERLRELHLGPFRIPGTDRIGDTLHATMLAKPDDIAVNIDSASFPVVDARGNGAGVRFSGVVAAGIRELNQRGPLAVVDPGQRIVGYARLTNVGKPMRPLAFSVPVKRGFDGYVKDYQPRLRYRLVSMATGDGDAWELGEIPAVAAP